MIVSMPGLGDIGVVADEYPADLPNNAWSRVQNARFQDGYAAKFAGHASIYGTPSVAPLYLQPMSTATGRFMIYAGTAKLYSVTNVTHDDITRGSGGDYTNAAGKLSGGVLGGIAIINNQVDAPQFWAGTGNAADLTNWPASTTCKVMRPFKNFLMACNVTKSGTAYPHMVKWSAPAVPGAVPPSWDETDPAQDAGEFDLADDQTRIVDAMQLGDQFIVYKEGAYYALQYIGPPQIFRQQKISNMAGALSLNCAAEYPGGHVVLAQGDLITHAGGGPQSIIDRRMRRWLFNNIDSTIYAQSFVAQNLTQNEIWVCFPQTGATSCTTALIWNYRDNTISLRDLPNINHANTGIVDFVASNSWDSDPNSWDSDDTTWNGTEFTEASQRLVMASLANTEIYLADSGKTFDGASISVMLEKEGMMFGDPSTVKMLKQIRPVIEANPGTVVQIATGGAMDLDAGTTWNAAQPFTVGTDVKFDTFATGRYLAIRITSTAQSSWRLRRMDVEIEPMGLW